MNIENFSTTNLPGLADLGDDPGPKGPIGPVDYLKFIHPFNWNLY